MVRFLPINLFPYKTLTFWSDRESTDRVRRDLCVTISPRKNLSASFIHITSHCTSHTSSTLVQYHNLPHSLVCTSRSDNSGKA